MIRTSMIPINSINEHARPWSINNSGIRPSRTRAIADKVCLSLLQRRDIASATCRLLENDGQLLATHSYFLLSTMIMLFGRIKTRVSQTRLPFASMWATSQLSENLLMGQAMADITCGRFERMLSFVTSSALGRHCFV